MKKAIFLAVLLVSASTIFARTNTAVSAGLSCPDTARSAVPSIAELLEEVMRVVGLQSSIELKEANVLNIEAAVAHRKRYIYYNAEYVNWLTALTRDKWALVALLAHEVGHHLNGHTIRRGGSRPELELEADEFAGFVLYKLGATLQQAQQVMNYIAKPVASKTHPARLSRLIAIQHGWSRAAKAERIDVASN